MDKSHFNLPNAIKNAYLFVGRQWLLMTQIALVPFFLQTLTKVLSRSDEKEINFLHEFVVQLPSEFFVAWMVFAQTRMIVLGEKPGRLPPDETYLADRLRALNLSVIVYILTAMGLFLAFFLLAWASSPFSPLPPTARGILTAFIFGGIIWGLRFLMLAPLMAVGSSAKAFLDRVHGLLISFRVLGLFLAMAVPVTFILMVALSLIIGDDLQNAGALAELSEMQIFLSMFLSRLAKIVIVLLFNAGCVFALKDMLGRKEGRRA